MTSWETFLNGLDLYVGSGGTKGGLLLVQALDTHIDSRIKANSSPCQAAPKPQPTAREVHEAWERWARVNVPACYKQYGTPTFPGLEP